MGVSILSLELQLVQTVIPEDILLMITSTFLRENNGLITQEILLVRCTNLETCTIYEEETLKVIEFLTIALL